MVMVLPVAAAAAAATLPRCPAVSRSVQQIPVMVQQIPVNSPKVPQRPACWTCGTMLDHAGPCWTICGTLTRAIELRTIQPKNKKVGYFESARPHYRLLQSLVSLARKALDRATSTTTRSFLSFDDDTSIFLCDDR
jgi:hypothetical protein